MRKLFAGLLLALVFPVAFAQTCPSGQAPQWGFQLKTGVASWSDSLSAACAVKASDLSGPFPAFGPGYSQQASVQGVTPPTACLIGTTVVGPDGYSHNSTPTTYYALTRCVDATPAPPPPACPSQNSSFFDGLQTTFEVPSGVTLSDLDTCAPSAPSQTSGSGCTVEYDGLIATGADGKRYFSGTARATSSPCTYSPTPTNTDLPKADYPPPPPETAKPPPPGTCPGEVNGELVFLPCSFGPSTETIDVSKTRANGTDTIADKFTGSTSCNATTCTWTVTSQSTSTSGGSTSKTQNGVATNTGDTGSDTGGDEQGEPCGGPGQPVCRVKVDETGTPTGQGAFSGLNQQADGVVQSMQGVVEGIKNSQIPSWSWTFQLPTGCTPFVMEAFQISIDICKYQPLIHDLMSLVWIASTISFLIWLFIRAD